MAEGFYLVRTRTSRRVAGAIQLSTIQRDTVGWQAFQEASRVSIGEEVFAMDGFYETVGNGTISDG